MADDKAARRRAKEQKEIEKWERELAKPKGNGYLWYLLFVVTVIYLADEIATQIGTQMSSVIAQDLGTPVFGAEFAVSRMGIIGAIAAVGTFLAFLYKPLSDRYGRRFFLILNTLGMGVGLIVIGLATNIPVYLLGCIVVNFFVPNDVQQLYLFESIPASWRNRAYAVIKGITTLGVLIVPVLRDAVMGTDITQWHNVYYVTGLIGVAAAVIAVVHIRETEPFIHRRLEYLRMTDEERARKAEEDKNAANADGGLVPAFKYCFKTPQLRYLILGSALITWGCLMTMNYEAVMSQGFMTGFMAQGMDTSAARETAVPLVTSALLFYPIAHAVFRTLQGFVSDKLGRKPTVAIMGFVSVATYVLFYLGATNGWSPTLVGLLCGASTGAYWATGDTAGGIMCSESSPTNLRASVMTVQTLVSAALTFVVGIVAAIATNVMGDAFIGPVNLVIAIPGMLAGTLIIMTKAHETKGVNLEEVE